MVCLTVYIYKTIPKQQSQDLKKTKQKIKNCNRKKKPADCVNINREEYVCVNKGKNNKKLAK